MNKSQFTNTSESGESITVSELSIDVPAPNEGARRTNTVRWILDNNIVQPSGKKLVDLGAGPCIFAKIALDRGYQVTAVDGRTVRLPDPSELDGINFVESDVRDFSVEDFDMIFMFGLLYHFDIEDQISLLKRCAKRAVVILDTQVHVPSMIALTTSNGWETRLIERDNYTGVEFPEGDNPMAAIGNKMSFWHTEDSILQLFSDSGFSRVTIVNPIFQSKYGGRRFYILES